MKQVFLTVSCKAEKAAGCKKFRSGFLLNLMVKVNIMRTALFMPLLTVDTSEYLSEYIIRFEK